MREHAHSAAKLLDKEEESDRHGLAEGTETAICLSLVVCGHSVDSSGQVSGRDGSLSSRPVVSLPRHREAWEQRGPGKVEGFRRGPRQVHSPQGGRSQTPR
jgi:hypothetical protein